MKLSFVSLAGIAAGVTLGLVGMAAGLIADAISDLKSESHAVAASRR